MKSFPDIPDFASLDAESITRLDDARLAAAGCTALDLLHEACPKGVEGMLEFLEEDEAQRLQDAFWSVHLVPHLRRVPEEDPWPGAEAHELEECATALVREACAREAAGGAPLTQVFAGLGDDMALAISVRIEDWRLRMGAHQEEDPAPGDD